MDFRPSRACCNNTVAATIVTDASKRQRRFSQLHPLLNMNVNVLVIGAGQAGMAAAHRLLKRGRSVHVIEAHSHVGGRTRNFDVKTQQYDTATDDAVDLGGTWISPDHTEFLKLCHELGVDVFRASCIDMNEGSKKGAAGDDDAREEWPWWYWGPDYTEEEMRKEQRKIFHHVTTADNKHTKFDFRTPSELLHKMEPSTVDELDKVGNIVENTATQLQDLSWSTPKPGVHWSETDSLTTSAKLMSSLQTSCGRNVLRNVIRNKNAQEPEQVSFLYNMISFKGCNSTGPGSEYRVRGGTQAVPLAIANDVLGPGLLTLGDPVQSVQFVDSTTLPDQQEEQHITVCTKSGKVFTSNALIVTGSPPAIMGIDFQPPLPSVQAQLLQRMPMGTCRKFCSVYKRGPWWRKFGYTGDILVSGLPKELSVATGANSNELLPIVGQCFDTSPFSQEFGVLTCFVEGNQNLYFSNLNEEEQRGLMRQFLKLTFQDLDAEDIWEPDFYVTHNWSDDPFVRGAYTAYFPPGVLSVPEWWEAYRNMEKMPSVFLAGADYHTGFGNGYIEGAVRSGQHAADLIDKRLSAK